MSNLSVNEIFKITNNGNNNKCINFNNQLNSFINGDNVNIQNKTSKNSNNNSILEFNKISAKFPNCDTNINNKVIY